MLGGCLDPCHVRLRCVGIGFMLWQEVGWTLSWDCIRPMMSVGLASLAETSLVCSVEMLRTGESSGGRVHTTSGLDMCRRYRRHHQATSQVASEANSIPPGMNILSNYPRNDKTQVVAVASKLEKRVTWVNGNGGCRSLRLILNGESLSTQNPHQLVGSIRMLRSVGHGYSMTRDRLTSD